jgi:hypothetical protein
LSGLAGNTTYYWQVRATNAIGSAYGNGSSTDYWSFTTGALPGTLNKISPTTAVTNQPLSLTLSWEASTGAASYEYCYDKTNDNACTGWVSNGTSTSKLLSGLAGNTTYYWQVRAVNPIGMTYANGVATSYWSFKTGSMPAAFLKTSPATGAINRPVSPTLKWGASSGATSYEYCYDTTNDSVCSTSWISNGASTSVILNLLPNTTYYWQVRAVSVVGMTYANGSATSFWNFKTGVLPGILNKSGPSDATINQPVSLTLSWSASTGATSYWYCYDTSNDNACTTWVSNGTATSKLLSGLAGNTTYYWQVRATNAIGSAYGNGSSTDYWSFTTGALPGTLNKISPTTAVTNQPLSLTLSWEASTGAASYEYCYDKTNDNACTGWVSNGTSTSKLLSGLAGNTTYYWQVRAVNPIGMTYANGVATSYWSFKTGSMPAAFLKTSPATGAINRPVSPTLKWGASSGATSYEYCYDTTNDSVCSTSWISNGASTSVILNLLPNTTYYWQVRAVSVVGMTYANGSATSFWNFKTISPLLSPTLVLILPFQASITFDTTPDFTWNAVSGASKYEIQIDDYQLFHLL